MKVSVFHLGQGWPTVSILHGIMQEHALRTGEKIAHLRRIKFLSPYITVRMIIRFQSSCWMSLLYLALTEELRAAKRLWQPAFHSCGDGCSHYPVCLHRMRTADFIFISSSTSFSPFSVKFSRVNSKQFFTQACADVQFWVLGCSAGIPPKAAQTWPSEHISRKTEPWNPLQ